jgi:hypothetical protein
LSFAASYKRFRGSKAFVLVLSSIIGAVMVLHWTIGFDPDWGGLNLFLSIEASLSMAIFMALQEQIDRIQAANDNFQRDQLKYMLTVLDAQRAQSKSQAEMVKAILEILRDMKRAT